MFKMVKRVSTLLCSVIFLNHLFRKYVFFINVEFVGLDFIIHYQLRHLKVTIQNPIMICMLCKFLYYQVLKIQILLMNYFPKEQGTAIDL